MKLEFKNTYSIIVPFHNAEKTIGKTIEALLRQDVLCQIILVNDHSTDNSVDVCNKYKSYNQNIEVIENEGKGVSAARNTGLRNATGDIIGFCDADDYYDKDTLKYVEECFEYNNNVGIVTVGIRRVYEEKQNIKISFEKNVMKKISMNEFICQMSINENIMGSVWNKFYKNAILQGISFDTKLTHCEDTHFNYKVLDVYKNMNIYLIDKACYNYVISETSTTGNIDNVFDEDGKLKYIHAFDAIEKDCSLKMFQRLFVKYIKVRLALDYIIKVDKNGIRNTYLKKCIRENILPYLLYFFRYETVTNIKRMIRYFKFLIT